MFVQNLSQFKFYSKVTLNDRPSEVRILLRSSRRFKVLLSIFSMWGNTCTNSPHWIHLKLRNQHSLLQYWKSVRHFQLPFYSHFNLQPQTFIRKLGKPFKKYDNFSFIITCISLSEPTGQWVIHQLWLRKYVLFSGKQHRAVKKHIMLTVIP